MTFCRILIVCLAASLAGCATTGGGDIGKTPWAQHSSMESVAGTLWTHHRFAGKAPTAYRPLRVDGREAIEVKTDASASMVRSRVSIEPEALGRLRFSWKVPALIAQADLGRRESDDSPVRVILAFDGDRTRWSDKDAVLSELSRTLTGEEMPFATLMYVWCNRRDVGTVIMNPRTERIRKLVVETGPRRLGHWQEYERDVRADYERAFGEPPGRLIGVAIMSDTDNTRTATTAWYGPLGFVSNPAPNRSGESVSPR